MVSNQSLSTADIVNLFKNVSLNKVSHTPAVNPKDGCVFVYNTQTNLNDWRADGYLWKNRGHKHLSTHPFLRKDYFSIKAYTNKQYDNGFRRMSWTLICNSNYTVVQYIGDCSLYDPRPHGNSRKQDRPFKRCAPSFMQYATTALKTCKPAFLYKTVISGTTVAGKHHGILNARNTKQLENIRQKVLNGCRLSSDALSNVIELYYHITDFIRRIDIVPNFNCVMAAKDIIEMTNDLLGNSLDPVIFSYDTTFNIGDYYVSLFVMKHPYFKSNPVIPVAFLLHDRKFYSVHHMFLQVLVDIIPRLMVNNCGVVIIVDREKSLTKSIRDVLPNARIAHCCNHLQSDVESWLYKQQAEAGDRIVYKRNVHQLMHCADMDEYQSVYDMLSIKWSQPFVLYYKKYIEQDLLQYCSKWVLQSMKIYNNGTGITNNMCESYNNVVKSFTPHKNIPADIMVTTAYKLQRSSYLEIRRGLAGIGNYFIKEDCKQFAIDAAEINDHNMISDIDQYVKTLKCELNHVKKNCITEEKDLQKEHVNRSFLEDHDYGNAVTMSSKLLTSQQVLAELVVKEHRITSVTSMNCYVVKSHEGKCYAITLSPKESCQCPSTSVCHHVLAAKIMAGTYTYTESRKSINLSELKKRSRSYSDKRSGRKKTRFGDIDVIPAPDSTINKHIINQHADIEDSFTASTPMKKITHLHSDDITGYDSKFGKKSKLSLKKKLSSHIHMQQPSDVDKELVPGSTLIINQYADIDHASDFTTMKGICDVEIPIHSDDIDDYKSKFKKRSKLSLKKKWPSNDNKEIQQQRTKRYWVETLPFAEKYIITSGGWLTDLSINASQQLLKQQYQAIGGLNDTAFVPMISPETKKWVYVFPMPEVTEHSALQIHHNNASHWVMSCRVGNNIFVCDSMLRKQTTNLLSQSLQIQLCSLYGAGLHKICVNIPSVQQQSNSSDCGLYAIAHAVNFCAAAMERNISPFYLERFEEKELRKHLINCLEKGIFTRFPSESDLNSMSQKMVVHRQIIVMNCSNCQLPDIFDDMVLCDECKLWMHQSCTGSSFSVNDTN